MLYNNNVCKLTVFKKYCNRSSTAALEWYLNNFFAGVGGGVGEGISILKCSFSLFLKFNFTLFEKNLARWPDINCRHCFSAFRSFVDTR